MKLTVVAQVPPDFIRVRPVDLAFREHGERGIVALSSKLFYLCVCARLLPSELIAGEGKDLETLLSILLVEVCQLSVIVGCQASFCRHIYEHDNLFIRNKISNLD